MPVYTFKPSDFTQLARWSDPSFWVGGAVPNDTTADVIFPVVTYVSTGQEYTSDVVIQSGESFTAHSLTLAGDNLTISGALSVTGAVDASSHMISLSGTLSAGSLASFSAYGSGAINVAGLLNDSGQITGNGNLQIQAGQLSGSGSFIATNGTTSLTVDPGGYTNLSNGALMAGTLESDPGGVLSLNVGGLITTDASIINLSGGAIETFDAGSGQNVSITSTLNTVAASGTLNVSNSSYNFGPLSVDGHLQVYETTLTSGQITLTSTGLLDGSGSVVGPINNDGLIETSFGARLVLDGPVTGTGHIQIDRTDLELNGASGQAINFSEVSGGTLQLDQPNSYSGMITPTGHGDQIVLPNIAASSVTSTSYAALPGGGTLTINFNDGTSTGLNFAGNFVATDFTVSQGPQLLSSDPPSLLVKVGQSPAQPVCFVSGTAILTPAGEQPVEALRVGDAVTTWAGVTKSIKWVGSGTRLVTAADPKSRPVIVREQAIAPGVPHRDLSVTEGHALFLGGHLIPVSSLINGRSILWDDNAKSVTFFHIELWDHDILVANGAPAESYRDDGNREAFSRATGTHSQNPMPPYALVSTAGPAVDIIWGQLVTRAGGVEDGLIVDPDLHLIVDGHRLEPADAADGCYRFVLHARPSSVIIASRHVVPAVVGIARDFRRLGIGLRQVKVKTDTTEQTLIYDSNLLTVGYHEPEHDGRLRWTDGHAYVPVSILKFGTSELILDVACLARYKYDPLIQDRVITDRNSVSSA